MKRIAAVFFALLLCLMLLSCEESNADTTFDADTTLDEDTTQTAVESHEHIYHAATCITPRICKICEETEGVALGHTWTDATCEKPKSCITCNAREGKALGHKWTEITFTEGERCTVCNATGKPATKDTFDFDGYKYQVLISNRSTKTPNDFEPVNMKIEYGLGMAIHARKVRMFELYGVVLEYRADLRNNHAAEQRIKDQFLAMSNDHDLAVINTYSAASLALEGMLWDLNKVPYIDLTESWWDEGIVRDLTISDSVYFATGDITTTVDSFMNVTMHNKKLHQRYITDGTDVYSLAKEGKWTLDTVARLSKLASVDMTRDGVMDGRDRFGLLCGYDDIIASVFSSGGGIAEIGADGHLRATIESQNAIGAMKKYIEIMSDKNSVLNYQNSERMRGESMFGIVEEQRALFFMTILNESFRFKDKTLDFGILPFPKYDESQAEYTNSFNHGLAAFVAIPRYQDNIERTGAVVQLLGYEGEHWIKPAYREYVLERKDKVDEESRAVLDIILDNKVADIGACYGYANMPNTLVALMESGDADRFTDVYVNSVKDSLRASNINSKLDKLKR